MSLYIFGPSFQTLHLCTVPKQSYSAIYVTVYRQDHGEVQDKSYFYFSTTPFFGVVAPSADFKELHSGNFCKFMRKSIRMGGLYLSLCSVYTVELQSELGIGFRQQQKSGRERDDLCILLLPKLRIRKLPFYERNPG